MNINIYNPYVRAELELYHHGVVGQKWGTRNGPPYPLNRGHAGKYPNVKEIRNYKGGCYFISEKPVQGNHLTPRVPSNFFTKNGYEDNTTKRICFSTSVDKCLTALSQNNTDKTFHVYKPKKIPSIIYKPNKKAVPDAEVTDELWIDKPVDVVEVGKIRCTGDDGKDGIPFKWGSNTAELYGWNYEWINDKKR